MDYELYHHGVKGMKWGVRRFQKKDGSYTSAGKKRYAASSKPKKTEEELRTELAERKVSAVELGKTTATGALAGVGGLVVTGGMIIGSGMYSPALVGISVLNIGMSACTGAMAAVEGVKVASLSAQLKQAEKARLKNEQADKVASTINTKSTRGTPYFAKSEQERRRIDARYETKRAQLREQWKNATSESEKQRLLDEIDRREIEYLNMVERDW